MAVEIERSFILDKETFMANRMNLDLAVVRFCNNKTIHQNYLVPENSSISYNAFDQYWDVTLRYGAFDAQFTIEVDSNEHKKIVSALSKMVGDECPFENLEAIENASARVRLIGDDYKFTFKTTGVDPLARQEFEYDIDQTAVMFENGDSFMDLDPFVVKKKRTYLKTNTIGSDGKNIVLELDEFENESFGCYLEAEFPTIKEAQEFDFSKWCVGQEITGVAGYTNKDLALKAGYKAMTFSEVF
ncbi:CYTH domain-containing protein [Photobacterium damselae]|uniref:CYTH domain-containing protein n=1 Tax=Photobacterium damselae TaxID=38293 RepID=UPI004067AC54